MSLTDVRSAVYGQYVPRGTVPTSDILRIETSPLPTEVTGTDVLVKMLAAPINPSDMNQLEGTYGTQPPLPAVAGNEGIGIAVTVGPESTIKQDSLVIANNQGLGTWRTALLAPSSALYPLFGGAVSPADVDIPQLSTMVVNPCTAYLMLKELAPLKKGDVVAFNAASSQVGLHLAQLARHWGFRTLAIVRDGPNYDYHLTKLTEAGATWVVKEGYTSASVRALGVPPVALALNAVGGPSSEAMAKLLAPGATMATYGGLGKAPVMVPTPKLLFHGVIVRGFWLTKWLLDHPARVPDVYEDVSGLIRSGVIRADIKEVPFRGGDGLMEAVKEAYTPTRPGKTVMMMQQ